MTFGRMQTFCFSNFITETPGFIALKLYLYLPGMMLYPIVQNIFSFLLIP